jgi:phage gpG-like protein
MRISHKISGVEKVVKALEKFQADAMSGQVEAVQTATLMIHESAVKSIQENARGTPDIRYNPKRVVLVSLPGEPPNTDTGRAAQSVKVEFEKEGLVGLVGTNLKYLAALEFAGKHRQPRPWLSTAVKATSKQIAEIFRKAVTKAVK